MFFSVLDMKASFRRFVSKYYMIGSFLVVILAFIGIMNFFNTTATSVISRKKRTGTFGSRWNDEKTDIENASG